MQALPEQPVMWTCGEIVRFLMDRGLLAASRVVESGVRVVNSSRRNRTLKVIVDGGPSYVVKQGVGEGRRRTVAHEAEVYSLLGAVGHASPLQALLARCVLYEPGPCILVLELVGKPTLNRAAPQSWKGMRRAVADSLGRALGVLHGSIRLPAPAWNHFPIFTPLPFAIRRPDPRSLLLFSGANIELCRLVQSSAQLCEALDSAAADWTPESIIHGDVRFDNCVSTGEAGASVDGVRLIDWEFAARGDPAWDVGAMFAEYLRIWLLSMPAQADPGAAFPLARFHLDSAWPALRRFWAAYVEARGFSAAKAASSLDRAVRCAGVRLIQVAFESLQHMPCLNGTAVYLAQLSANILRRPQEASEHLLGLGHPS